MKLVVTLLVVCSSTHTVVRGFPPSANRCPIEPRHHAAFGHWANRINDTHRLSLLSPALHRHAFRTINEDDLSTNGALPLAGATECPASPDSSLDEPLMGRSLCPWYWKMNYNPGRVPAMLPEAVCRCQRAAVQARGLVPYECQPLTMHVRVLELDERCEAFHERTVEVAVACVSVLQPSVRLSKVDGVQRLLEPMDTEQEIK